MSAVLFSDAADLAQKIDGQVFDTSDMPFSISRLVTGSHSSQLESDTVHVMALADRSYGHLEVQAEGGRATARTRDGLMTFSPAGSRPLYRFDGHTENIVLSFDEGFGQRLAEREGGIWNSAMLDTDAAFFDSDLAALIRRQYATVKSNDPGWRVLSEAMAMSVMAALFNRFCGTQGHRSHTPLSDAELTLLTEFIDAHLEANIGLVDLADLVERDVCSLSRAFKAKTGTSPVQLVISARIARIRRLLDTDASLAEISYACGFSSQAHMTTTFAKHMGTTPGRYRKDVSQ